MKTRLLASNLLLLLAPLAVAGCVQPTGSELPDESRAHADAMCVATTLEGATTVRATASGVVYAIASGDTVTIHRASGAGCDLDRSDARPIAAGELLDADDAGNVYAFPAEANAKGAISTMLPDEYPGSMVAVVDASGAVSKLLPAGRGIWDFGVTPAGDALYVTACGPNGLFSIGEDGVTPSSLAPPDTLWEQMPSALTDAGTFWSVGVQTCAPGAPTNGGCGFALTRTTKFGSTEHGSTFVDLGLGPEQLTLVRCGARVCGRGSGGVVVWEPSGERARALGLADLDARPGERVVDVTGNADGLYVILATPSGPSRVVFSPEE